MSHRYYDIIIIGSGISGLYSAYNIKTVSPNTSFLVLEKYKKAWIGGRTSNDEFYSTEIVTGAGIGRRSKDKLLHRLVTSLGLPTHDFLVKPYYSQRINPVDIAKAIDQLRREYKKMTKGSKETNEKEETFKQFASRVLGEKEYKRFILSAGYTDYENEDIFETLYYYGMEDNTCCWRAFHVPWRRMVMKLYRLIGEKHFSFSSKAVNIIKMKEEPCRFQILLENGAKLYCNRVIIASTIDTVRKLIPRPIYQDIEGQPFLRLYAKFAKKSIPIMKEYVKGFTFVPGPLQRIIPMNPNNGVYMIAYNDNNNTIALKNHLENNAENRELYEQLLEQSLGMPEHSLHIIAIKDYYWPIGTHYYKPLNKELYKNREEFIEEAQHPEKGILVVGEAVSRNQGWTEGALESVKAVLTKKWIQTAC
jgi:hypothetical protein